MPAAQRPAHPGDDLLLACCRALPGVTEDVKWGNDLVFSVGGKMFAVFALPDAESLSFKVDPLTFGAMSNLPGIAPAPYLARHSWIRLAQREALPADTLTELLRGSWALVAGKLPRRQRRELGLD